MPTLGLLMIGGVYACWRPALQTAGPLHHPPADHHERDVRECRDVLQRVAVDGDQVGLVAGGDAADGLTETERFGGEGRGREDGRHRVLSALAHAILELLEVAAVRA